MSSTSQYFQVEPDILTIIHEGKLTKFILGKDDFRPFTHYPEEDYQRWNAVESFYKGLDEKSPLRGIIAQTVLSLYDQKEEKAKFASITLCRLLELRRIAEKIHSSVSGGEYTQLNQWLQKEILLTISELELNTLIIFIVKAVMEKGLLEEYLAFWRYPPLKEEVAFNENDLWRMKSIAEYYNTSDEEERIKALSLLIRISGKRPKVKDLLGRFLTDQPFLDDFKKAVQAALDKQLKYNS